ncbi:MAG: hypothetical protein JJU41_08120 [Bacteroidetes bacterium]|nr:hypothetical protein [Bacteroidota bacterium]MCH8525177.1 hypothetical protein [Balneolales bacterium]
MGKKQFVVKCVTDIHLIWMRNLRKHQTLNYIKREKKDPDDGKKIAFADIREGFIHRIRKNDTA